MAEDRDALLQHYREMRKEMLSVIDGLSDELMTETSLDGWSVKDHLAHIAHSRERGGAHSAGHDSAWRMSGELDEAYNALVYEMRRELPLAQVRWELATSRERLLDAISATTARGLDASLYGEAGLHSTHEAQHAGWIRRWRGEKGV